MDKISRGAVPKHMKMIADTLKVEADTIMIPFSAETKQGREDIWELIDSLVLPEDDEETAADNAENQMEDCENANEERTANQADTASLEPEKQRKPRWKATGKETAKKTKKLQEKKAAKSAKIAKSKKKK